MLEQTKDILLLQKREKEVKLKEKYIERSAVLQLKNNLIKVIIGPRRAGKSFFAMHFLKNTDNFGYVNFDDEKLIELQDYDEIITAMNSIYNNPKYLLLDEIQNLAKWELFVNRLQRQGYNLVITGSNSNLLSKELATHLTGRHVSTTVLPFSFKEYVALENKELTKNEKEEKLLKYLLNGGYPEIVSKDIQLKEYLGTLFHSILYKDIVKRYNIRNPQQIENLAVFLLSNVANEYSYNSLTKIGQVKSSHTIEKYVTYLENSFILFSLKRFSYKIKEQLSSNKKIYCVDNGFIQAKAFKLNPDFGKLYENTVACKLKQEEYSNGITIYYWKNAQQEEVDFLIQEGTKVKQLIQVCYSLENPDTKNREIRSLLKAGKELNCTNLLIINNEQDGEKEVEWFGIKAKVKFIPLWKWLLKDTFSK